MLKGALQTLPDLLVLRQRASIGSILAWSASTVFLPLIGAHLVVFVRFRPNGQLEVDKILCSPSRVVSQNIREVNNISGACIHHPRCLSRSHDWR